jgi:hypothetical protein
MTNSRLDITGNVSLCDGLVNETGIGPEEKKIKAGSMNRNFIGVLASLFLRASIGDVVYAEI